MTTKIEKEIAQLRKIDFKPWNTTIWMVKRRLMAQAAHYSVLRVDVDKKLQDKLKRAVTGKIQSTDYRFEKYDFLTADQDNRVFTLESGETDFAKIQAEIENGFKNKKVEKYEDLLDSWAYVVKLEYDGNIVYGSRKINKFTRATKIASIAYFIYENQKLIDLEDKKVFTIDTHIDFFVYNGTAFITNKKEFESAMNFREGMEKNRDEVLNAFAALKVFSDVEPIRQGIGSNLHLLRKIATIRKSGYYKDKSYLINLLKLNNERGWGLRVDDGIIVVDETNVELVLKLLNNDRLESPINQEMFDASVKKKVG